MINWLHARLHNPLRGWDPVPAAYAAAYADGVTAEASVVDAFESELGGFENKRVVDLGSGPGQYAAEFARRGAHVSCVDVSAAYLAIARRNISLVTGRANFVAGYMDDVAERAGCGFDGAFSNASWYYCMNDFSFAKRIAAALAPGGIVMVRANNERYEQDPGVVRLLVYWLNRRLAWKMGHPHPPQGRIALAFQRLNGWSVEADYRDPLIDLVIARKPRLPSWRK